MDMDSAKHWTRLNFLPRGRVSYSGLNFDAVLRAVFSLSECLERAFYSAVPTHDAGKQKPVLDLFPRRDLLILSAWRAGLVSGAGVPNQSSPKPVLVSVPFCCPQVVYVDPRKTPRGNRLVPGHLLRVTRKRQEPTPEAPGGCEGEQLAQGIILPASKRQEPTQGAQGSCEVQVGGEQCHTEATSQAGAGSEAEEGQGDQGTTYPEASEEGKPEQR